MSRGRDAAPSRIARPAAWSSRPEAAGPEVAVLLTDAGDVAALVRGFRTVLPRARICLAGPSLSAEAQAVAEAAGADVLPAAPSARDALVRRMFAEIEADIYILAHAAGTDDACLAPLIVAEIEAGRDLVDVRRLSAIPAGDGAGWLLSRTVDFAFGGWGDLLHSDFKACSRRFALSYRRTTPPEGADDASARDLALHALRLRLPVGRVTALGSGRSDAASAPPPRRADWAGTLRIVARLLVEERPRRVFGLLGLGLMALGLAASVPDLVIHHGRTVLPHGAATVASLGLMASGAALGVTGVLLDSLASARQEVRRLGAAAIPRRAQRAAHPS